jgi:hypothetical protein
MTLPCEHCTSAAEPAAQMRTFECEGQTLHCLMFVSSCRVCGRRWDDARYDAVNLRSAEEARATMARGQRATNSAQSEVDPAREGTNAS